MTIANFELITDPPSLLSTTLYSDTYLHLMCNIFVIANSNVAITVDFQWFSPEFNAINANDTNYIIYPSTNSNGQHTSELRINRLTVARDNNNFYTCQPIITANSSSYKTSKQLTLNVQGIYVR